ncbi:MAG: protein kinase [Polyangiaceae bacterium]|nr:protein kinase [Polyangiaceae bacterium]
MPGDLFGLLGCVIDNRYRVDTVVGEGGFGMVYRGWHLAFDHAVAIKCLKVPAHFTWEARGTFLKRFREEGVFLSALAAHPAIVRVFDLNVSEREGGQAIPYLVLEWLEGVELEALLQERRRAGQGPMSEADALALLRPAVEALQLAHQLKIVHRDLKPRNLYLAETRQGTVLKVLDFGIAKALHDGEMATRLATGTTSGFEAFTPEYAAPEQFEGKRFGGTGTWTDVYAFGMILTELVLGRRAYQGDSVFALYGEATGPVRPTPRGRGLSVSDAFERLCARALAVNPADRFASANELLEAFDETFAAINGSFTKVSAPPLTAPSDPPLAATSDPPLAATSDPPLAATSDPPLAATSGPPSDLPMATLGSWLRADRDSTGESQPVVGELAAGRTPPAPSAPTHMVMAAPAATRPSLLSFRRGVPRWKLGLAVGLGLLSSGALALWLWATPSVPDDEIPGPSAQGTVVSRGRPTSSKHHAPTVPPEPSILPSPAASVRPAALPTPVLPAASARLASAPTVEASPSGSAVPRVSTAPQVSAAPRASPSPKASKSSTAAPPPPVKRRSVVAPSAPAPRRPPPSVRIPFPKDDDLAF